jgi:hypothetical protein
MINQKADRYSLALEGDKALLLDRAKQRFAGDSEVSRVQLKEADGYGRFFC